MLFAIPPVTIVEHEVRRIAGPRTHANQMLDAGARADHRPRIEDFDHGCDREQVKLGGRMQRAVVVR
jgi:hypothetical protein